MTNTLEGILSALAYYDAFDFPLTAQEIFFALPAADGPHPSFEDVAKALREAAKSGLVDSAYGMYYLPGRAEIAATRTARYQLAERKYKKALRFLALARYAPFLRAVFVCNTLARSYARPESDIDLYLVAAPGRIWITRLLVTGLAALLGARPTAEDSTDRVCLSFFVTSDALNLKPLAIDNDVYLAHWVQELYPVYDEAGIGRRSYAENGWSRDILPETRAQGPSPRRALAPAGSWKRAFERWSDNLFGDRLEDWARDRQWTWMPSALKNAASRQDSGVVVTDKVLKFHDRDRRAEIRDAYQKKLETLTYALRTVA